MNSKMAILNYPRSRRRPKRPVVEHAFFILVTGTLGTITGVILSVAGCVAFSVFHPQPLMNTEADQAALIFVVIGIGGVIGLVCGLVMGRHADSPLITLTSV
jgi:hypothetical protein